MLCHPVTRNSNTLKIGTIDSNVIIMFCTFRIYLSPTISDDMKSKEDTVDDFESNGWSSNDSNDEEFPVKRNTFLESKREDTANDFDLNGYSSNDSNDEQLYFQNFFLEQKRIKSKKTVSK